jgi:aspartate/glutamate racemase
MTLPIEVASNIYYLDSLGIWYLTSRNSPASSCADAATKRSRLGNIGIPRFDELKSHVGAYEHSGGRKYLVAHCRGHQLRDDEKLTALAGAPVERVSDDELDLVFGLKYGIVNPFYFARRPDIRQLFDRSVLERYYPPHTMMTNLGDAEYGVEFDPRDIVRAISNAEECDIVEQTSKRPVIEHCIGILTGNGPESGIALWERINARIRDSRSVPFRGDTGFPRVVIESVPDMGLSMELQSREPEVRETVVNGVERLCDAGATIIGIACNTTQYFSAEVRLVCAKYGATFVSLVDETANLLQRERITTFDLLGIGAVSDLNHWSDFRRLSNTFVIAIPSEADVTRITDLAFEVKKRRASGRAIAQLGRVIKHATVTDTVLLALTELSIVVETEPRLEKRSGKRFIDTLSVLADRMADMYLTERLALERTQNSPVLESGSVETPRMIEPDGAEASSRPT